MNFNKLVINCQQPEDGNNVDRTFNIIECTISTKSAEFEALLKKANDLASLVNGAAANNSNLNRLAQRKTSDAIMGILSEEAWLQYLNQKFDDIATYTPLTDVSAQIDIKLKNGEKLEIRSSYVRNGVKFALCHDRYNFKNLGPYSNTIKPGEIQKDFYLCALFESSKENLLTAETIKIYLIGGSSWQLMVDIGYNDALTPMDALVPISSNYRVIQLKNALDVNQIVKLLSDKGYNPR